MIEISYNQLENLKLQRSLCLEYTDDMSAVVDVNKVIFIVIVLGVNRPFKLRSKPGRSVVSKDQSIFNFILHIFLYYYFL